MDPVSTVFVGLRPFRSCPGCRGVGIRTSMANTHGDLLFHGTSNPAVHVGGNYNNNANAGLSYVNNNTGGSNSNNGSRLVRTPDERTDCYASSATPLGGIGKQKQTCLVPLIGSDREGLNGYLEGCP